MQDQMLGCDFLLECELATVVAALTANSVETDRCTTVGANAQSGGYCLVVGATLVTTGLGMVSLRMCHFAFCFGCL